MFRGVGWKYGEGISGLAGAWYGNHLHPIVCALRNGTFGLIPVLVSKCLWSPKPDSVASQVTSALGGVQKENGLGLHQASPVHSDCLASAQSAISTHSGALPDGAFFLFLWF